MMAELLVELDLRDEEPDWLWGVRSRDSAG